jgi:hypothetical protein
VHLFEPKRGFAHLPPFPESMPKLQRWIAKANEYGLATSSESAIHSDSMDCLQASRDDTIGAINRFVIEHNAKPKPFTWTADPDKIIQAVRRGHQVSDSIH